MVKTEYAKSSTPEWLQEPAVKDVQLRKRWEIILAVVLTFVTLVNVDVAVRPNESFGARAIVFAGDDVRLTYGAGVARVAGARVLQVAEQAGPAGRALAVVVGDAVVARAAVEARLRGAVVLVLLAVVALVAVHADALVAVVGVGARGAVLADALVHRALVHVFRAEAAGEFGRALALVAADAVEARGAVLAEVVAAVVVVHLAPIATEACRLKT